ncbi:MAG: hypothetical protein IJC99_04755 [Clostridia bacterium]|nr:hypothetical protein [Clostridia bacterium]
MKTLKVYYFLKVLISTLFGVGVGLLLLALAPYATELFDIMIIAIGLLTLVMNIPALFLALKNLKARGEWLNLLMALLSIALGVALMLLRSNFLIVLVVLYAIVLPLVRVILVEQHLRQLRHEMLPFLTGATVIFIYLAEAESLILRYGALVVFLITALYFVHGLLVLRFRFVPADEAETETVQSPDDI